MATDGEHDEPPEKGGATQGPAKKGPDADQAATAGMPAPHADALRELLVNPVGEQGKWCSLLDAALRRIGEEEPERLPQMVSDLESEDFVSLVGLLRPQLDELVGAVLRDAVAARVMNPWTAQPLDLTPASLWAARRCLPAVQDGADFSNLDALCVVVGQWLDQSELDDDNLYSSIVVTQLLASDMERLKADVATPDAEAVRSAMESVLNLDEGLLAEHLQATRTGQRTSELAREEFEVQMSGRADGQGTGAHPDVAQPRLRLLVGEPGAYFVEFDGALVMPWRLDTVYGRLFAHLMMQAGREMHALDVESLVDGSQVDSAPLTREGCLELAERLDVKMTAVGEPSPAVGALLRRLQFLRSEQSAARRARKRGWTVEKEEQLILEALSDPAYVPLNVASDPVMRSVKWMRRAFKTGVRTLASSSEEAADFYNACVGEVGELVTYVEPES